MCGRRRRWGRKRWGRALLCSFSLLSSLPTPTFALCISQSWDVAGMKKGSLVYNSHLTIKCTQHGGLPNIGSNIYGFWGDLQQGPMTYVFPATHSKLFNRPVLITVTCSQLCPGGSPIRWSLSGSQELQRKHSLTNCWPLPPCPVVDGSST